MSDDSFKTTLRNYATWYLSRKECSVFELRKSMNRRVISLSKKLQIEPPEGIATWIDEFLESWVKSGVLSDERFQKMATRSQLAKNKGYRAIQMKLQTKGVKLTPDAYKKHLEEEGVEDVKAYEVARIGELLRRKYPGYSSDRKIAQRAFGFLMRRGFSSSDIQTAMKTKE